MLSVAHRTAVQHGSADDLFFRSPSSRDVIVPPVTGVPYTVVQLDRFPRNRARKTSTFKWNRFWVMSLIVLASDLFPTLVPTICRLFLCDANPFTNQFHALLLAPHLATSGRRQVLRPCGSNGTVIAFSRRFRFPSLSTSSASFVHEAGSERTVARQLPALRGATCASLCHSCTSLHRCLMSAAGGHISTLCRANNRRR